MKKLVFILLFLLIGISFTYSQEENAHTIKGKVIDAITKEPLEYATVTFKAKGNSGIIGGVTDRKGKFEIIVPSGKYNVTVEYLAYKTITFKSQDITNNVHYGSIELSEDTELLEDIEIVAEKKTVEIKPKKLVYNVTKDIAAEGSMIMDVLNNVPSVSVQDGNAVIRGQIATVMINGKTSSLTKEDALKSLPAGTVEKIEVITNPGAQYKASYNSIINIILKKGKDEGLNASITGSFGHREIYGGLLSVNYKTKGVNFFTNTSYSHKNEIELSKFNNQYFTSGMSSSFLNEDLIFDNNKNGLYTTVGADFELSKKTTLTTYINYSNLNYNSITNTDSDILDASRNLVSTNNRKNLRDFKDDIAEFVVETEHQFNDNGKSFSASIQHTNDVESITNNVMNSNSSFTDEIFTQNNKIINTEFNIKYVNPFSKTSTYTIGYNGVLGKVPFRNSTPNKNINYTENIHGAYIDYEYQKGKFYAGAGIRGEFSKATTEYLNQSIEQNIDINKLFPSAILEYYISDSKSISLFYGKGIQRVDYGRLQPFEERFSETFFYKGNELLTPMFIDNYSLDYTYSGDNITIAPSLFFSQYDNYWQDVTYETGEQIDGVNKLITTPHNVGKLNYYGLNLTAVYKATKNLNLTFNSSIYNLDQRGVFEITNSASQPITIDYTNENLNGNFSLLSQFNFPGIIKFQTNINHYLESKGPVSTRKAYTYANFAASKDLFDKKATLSLNVSDIANSNQLDRNRFDANFLSTINKKNKNPDIILSFTYRFNQSKSNRVINFDKKDTNPNY